MSYAVCSDFAADEQLDVHAAPEREHRIIPKPLSAAEEKQYLERYAAGDLEARNILIEHNLRLVAHIMKKYYTQSGDQEDLISIGTIGLIKGISSFDPAKGARLATYAARCIENTILT